MLLLEFVPQIVSKLSQSIKQMSKQVFSFKYRAYISPIPVPLDFVVKQ